MRKILLDGVWEGMRSSNGSTFPATVPGFVHTDLMKIGQLPGDIYWRDTAKQVQWIENEAWIAFDCKLKLDEIPCVNIIVRETKSVLLRQSQQD